VTRTKKGKKAPGFDFCTKRPGNKGHGGHFGPERKKETHKAERAQGKQALLKEPREPEFDPQEDEGDTE
jgi:hypothetical protein